MAPMNWFHSVICLSFVWKILYLLILTVWAALWGSAFISIRRCKISKQCHNLGHQNRKPVMYHKSDLTLRYYDLDDLTWNFLDFFIRNLNRLLAPNVL